MDKNKLKYSIKNMAIKAMKDNFLSLSDEEKQKEFCELLDKNNKMQQDKQELIDYLKEKINECKSTGNDEDYIKADVYKEILSKIEKV